MQKVGNAYYAKVWEEGETEPVDWLTSNENFAHPNASGCFGIMRNRNSSSTIDHSLDIYGFGIGTDGDPAPRGPVEPGGEPVILLLESVLFPASGHSTNSFLSSALGSNSVSLSGNSVDSSLLIATSAGNVNAQGEQVDMVVGVANSELSLDSMHFDVNPEPANSVSIKSLTNTGINTSIEDVEVDLNIKMGRSVVDVNPMALDTPFVLTMNDSDVNTVMFLKLGMLGHEGSLHDRLYSYFKAEGANGESLVDLEKDWLTRIKGASYLAVNQQWYWFTGSLGYTGTISDRIKAYWFNL
jgi:hypothetical protein